MKPQKPKVWWYTALQDHAKTCEHASKYRGRHVLGTASPKTVKGEKFGFLTGIVYLAPGDMSGREVCPNRSAGCTAGCLNTAGRGIFDATQEARIAKTRWLFACRRCWLYQLCSDIEALQREAKRKKLRPCVRLNGTSDLRFELFAKWIFDAFPGVQFYDYSKDPRKMSDFMAGKLPSNYHVTFSLAEGNWTTAAAILESGGNVAFPYDVLAPKAEKFETFLRSDGYPAAFGSILQNARAIVDGDVHDLTFLHSPGTLVALTAKGKAKHDRTGFIVRF